MISNTGTTTEWVVLWSSGSEGPWVSGLSLLTGQQTAGQVTSDFPSPQSQVSPLIQGSGPDDQ